MTQIAKYEWKRIRTSYSQQSPSICYMIFLAFQPLWNSHKLQSFSETLNFFWILCVLYYSLSFTFGDHLVASKYQVELLCRLRSPYLLPLIGYCSECSHKLLVYEFMANGGLQEHLYPINGMYLVFSCIWFCASWNLLAAFFCNCYFGAAMCSLLHEFLKTFLCLTLILSHYFLSGAALLWTLHELGMLCAPGSRASSFTLPGPHASLFHLCGRNTS